MSLALSYRFFVVCVFSFAMNMGHAQGKHRFKKNSSASASNGLEKFLKKIEDKNKSSPPKKSSSRGSLFGGGIFGGRDAFIKGLKKYEGKLYSMGAVGPNSFDCSGFVSFILIKEKGCLKIPGRLNSRNMSQYLKRRTGACQLGDIIARSGSPGHAGFYLEKGVLYGAVGGKARRVQKHNYPRWGTCYVNPCFR